MSLLETINKTPDHPCQKKNDSHSHIEEFQVFIHSPWGLDDEPVTLETCVPSSPEKPKHG
jgi:hypothetical protein